MADDSNSKGGFHGRRVLSLESRRAREMGLLIASNGGEAMVAPATREVPAASNADAVKFVSELLEGKFATVIFLTGVGMRALAKTAETVCPREKFVEALGRTAVVARGPKPVAALRELGVPIAALVPEPNTWRELLALLDERADSIPLRGCRVAVQEYGVPSPELVAGLTERGAEVHSVHVYDWALPEDTEPLRAAVQALLAGEVAILIATSAVQVRHLFQIAREMNVEDELARALARAVVASIGPVTSAELVRHGVAVDMEPSHPKMGFLVKEAAEKCDALIRRKHAD